MQKRTRIAMVKSRDGSAVHGRINLHSLEIDVHEFLITPVRWSTARSPSRRTAMLLALFLATSAINATSAPPQEVDQSVQSKNGEFIFRQYPPRAKAAGERGTVRFQAEVDAKGNVMSCKVIGSSGYRRLDDETCEMIIDHATFKPTLDGDGKAREAIHNGIVNWRLPG